MPRKIQPTYTKARSHTLAAMGDSLTFNDVYWGVLPSLMWPEVLAVQLRGLGGAVKARNFGSAGHTTTQMLARIAQLWLYDVPAIAVIFGGVNDPGAPIAGATTQANIESMINQVIAAGCTRVVVANTPYLNF